MTLRATRELVGTVGLHIKSENDRAEIGYWIGIPCWGKGYATEAAAAVMCFGFQTFPINRIFAMPFGRNPASGRVLQKIYLSHRVK